jgi:D-tyrosyl-tRNA(Tyr) deacylase
VKKLRAVVQRVSCSEVCVDNNTIGKIDNGINVLLGVEEGDTIDDAKYIADKCVNLRIFEDGDGKLNLSVKDVGGSILAISQFTLLGDCRKGRRPSFITAAKPDVAFKLYKSFIELCSSYGIKVEEGKFQANMSVRIDNEGPVTILLDSKKVF